MKKTHKLILLFITIIPHLLFSKENDNFWKNEFNKQKTTAAKSNDESIKIGQNIIKKCKNDSIKALSLATLGSSYSNKSDYINAFKYTYQAKDLITPKTHNLNFLIYNNINLSDIYKRIGLDDRAQEELETTKKLVDNIDSENYYSKAILNMALGSLLCNLGQHNKAIPIYYEAEELLKKVKDKKLTENKSISLSVVYSDLSNIYLSSNDLKKAELYIKKAIKTLGKIKSFDTEYINTVTLAEVYTKTNKDLESIQLLLPLVDHPSIEPVFNQFIHDLLSTSYKNIGDLEKYQLNKKKSDSIQSSFTNQKFSGLKEAYKYIKNDLSKREIENNNLKIIFIIVVGIFLGIIFLGIRRYSLKLRQEKEAYRNLVNSLENKEKPKTKTKSPEQSEDVAYSKSELELIEKLNNFELQKGYLKKDITLAVLAVELNTNASYLSDIINKSKNKNINSYINELRINYIIKELYSNPALLNYKISYLAELAGFNSHNSFTLVFKKITSISPSVFLDERRKELAES